MKILGKRRINMIMLRSLSFRGIPNEVQGLRSVVWRVLLGYLPRETAKWEQYLKQQKLIYDEWKKDLIVEPYLIDSTAKDLANGEVKYQAQGGGLDHPLSVSDSSMWNKFFKDLDLWEEIEKDVRRTRSDMTFFIEAVDRTKNKDKQQLMKQAEVKKAHLHGDVR
jgi:TBC1 domain family member 13